MQIKVKQLISIIFVSIIMLILSSSVKATASYVVELVGNDTVQPGQQFEITIKLKDIVDITGGIAGLSVKLEYDTEKLEKVGSGTGLSGFMLVEGSTIEIATYPGVTNDTEIAKFTFKAKENITGSAHITLSAIEAVNGTATVTLDQNVTKVISVGTSSIKSENNNLSSLSIDGTSVSNFNKNTLTYTLTPVENDKTNINISAVTEDSKATMIGTGTKNLGVGNNTFNIVVTAENGSQKTYTIAVERKDVPGKDLPKTGIETPILAGIGIILTIAIISFIKGKNLSGI